MVKNCKKCTKKFKTSFRHPHQIFCSTTCRDTLWREKNIEYRKTEHKKWRNKNKDYVRIKSNETMKKWRLKCRLAVFKYYSNGTMSCNCCGEITYEFLCIDHINGGGRQERLTDPQKKGSGLYRWIIREGFPDGFQILCHNCNMAKGFYGKCPHKK